MPGHVPGRLHSRPAAMAHPRTWQAVMLAGLDKTDTKRASAIAAIRYQPSVDWRATPRCKKPHDGLTDAFCIAEYGRRQLVKRGVVSGRGDAE